MAESKKKRQWFRSSKGQYKKVVLAVYPKNQEEGIVVHNVSKLLFYAMTTPAELEKIGAFVEKRLREDLGKRRLGWVEVGARALNELTKACHKDLHLFAAHVISVMRLLFEDERSEMNILAVETFTRFAEFQDDVSQYDLDQFVPYFERMAAAQPADFKGRTPQELAKLRTAGLRGLDAYINRVSDLDTFVLTRVDAPPPLAASAAAGGRLIMACILDAMQGGRDKDKDREREAVAEAATSCLRDLGTRANHLTTRALVDAVLAYLDAHGAWTEQGEPFALEALKTLCFAIPPQFDHLTATRLLQHLDASPGPARVHIVHAITAVMRGSIASMIELVHSLLRHLQAEPRPGADERALQEALVACLGVAAQRVSDTSQRLEAIAYLLDRFPHCPSAASRASLAAALAALGAAIEPEPGRALPAAVFAAAVGLVAHKEEPVRRSALALVLRLLQQLVLVADAAPAVSLAGADEAPGRPHAHAHPTASLAPAMLLGPAGDLLRSALYHHAQLAGNTPVSYELLSRAFLLLQRRLGPAELLRSFPLMFHLQHRLAAKLPRDPEHLSTSLWGHALVAAYLAALARLLDCPELADLVRAVLKRRKAAGQQARALAAGAEGLEATGREELRERDRGDEEDVEGHARPAPAHVDVLFEREPCIDALCRLPALQQAVPDLRAALARKYRSTAVRAGRDADPLLPAPRDSLQRYVPSARASARGGPSASALSLQRKASMRPALVALLSAPLSPPPTDRRGDLVTSGALKRALLAASPAAAPLSDDAPAEPPASPSPASASPSPLSSPAGSSPLPYLDAARTARAGNEQLALLGRLCAAEAGAGLSKGGVPGPSPYSILALSFPTFSLI